MERRDPFTKALAAIGTMLAWLPLATTVVIGIVGSIEYRAFMVDYLMPMELFPGVLLAGAVLLWAALRARSRLMLVGGNLVAAIMLWFGTQALTEVTGLASGRTEPSGWPFGLVMAALVLYILSVVGLGVGGALLLRDLF